MHRLIFIAALVVCVVCLSLKLVRSQPAPPAGAPNPADQPDTSHWPLRIPSDKGDIVVFQPQLESFEGDELKGRAAVQVPGDTPDQPTYGVVWLDSRVGVDRVARTVQILDTQITKTNFPEIDDAKEPALAEQIRQAILSQPMALSLDQLLAGVQTIQEQKQEETELKTDAPSIIFRDHPAVLVQYDGPPKMVETPTPGILRAGNTPFFVALDSASKTYFLKGAGLWFASHDAAGPFQSAANVPPPVSQLADSSDYKDPQTPLSPQQAAGIEIVTATDPTELIWTDGPPQMTPIEGTNLLYVANTDSDWFIQLDTQQNFLLLSGRWYAGKNRSGPWTYVAPDQLPADFAKIPANSDKGDVLACVAGTTQANDAVANNQIPQTAAVDRANFDQPAVDYDGDPQFQPVEGDANCNYAINTESAVLQVGPDYFCCQDAVWYLGHDPRGPWAICTRVPQECYRLPPSCPLYPCRFVHVYGFTPDVCYLGYTPGYTGAYLFHHCVVYGTGLRYQPWVGRVFVSRPHTFGFAARYNAYVNHWGFSFGLATGGGGGTWIGNGPHSWGRSGRWFGFGGYRPVVLHNDVHASLFRNAYVARVRPTAVIRPGRSDIYARSVYDRRKDVRWDLPHSRAAEDHRVDEHAAAARGEEMRNDVFSDRDGHVYRKTDTGWESHDRTGWHGTPEPRVEHPPEVHEVPKIEEHSAPRVEEHPAPRIEAHPAPHVDTHAELNREFQARQAGEQRLQHYERPAPPPAARGDAREHR